MENQRPALGFLLALLATATWGTLPIAAQQVLKFIDAPTLVWIRFTVAASVLLFFWLRRGGCRSAGIFLGGRLGCYCSVWPAFRQTLC